MALSPERIAELKAQRAAKSGSGGETPEARALREMGVHKQAQAELLGTMNPLQKMLAGHGGDVSDMARKARQLYNLGIKATPFGGSEEDAALQETYAEEEAKRDMQRKGFGDDGWMTAGRIAGAVAPAIVGAVAAPAAAAPATLGVLGRASQQLALSVPAAVVQGNLSRPMVESEANLDTQLGNAGMDAAIGAAIPLAGAAYQAGRGVRHAINKTMPDEALDIFAHTQGSATRPITGVPTGMPLKSAAQENVANQVTKAVQRAKEKAGNYYKLSAAMAGNDNIRLNNLFAEGDLPKNISDRLANTKNPILNRLSGAAVAGSTSPIVGAKGESLAGGASMRDLIDARKTLSSVKRDILSASDPDTVAANSVNRLLEAADKDLEKWSLKNKKTNEAFNLYEKGRKLYRDEVVPLTDPNTLAGRFYRGGDTPEMRARTLLGPDAGPSVYRLNAQNPEVTPALRQQWSQLLLDARGKPEQQANMLTQGTATENLFTPDQLNWMRKTAEALRQEPGRLSPANWVARTFARREPVAVGAAGSAIQRALFGVDAYGAKPFETTSDPLLRAIMAGAAASQTQQPE